MTAARKLYRLAPLDRLHTAARLVGSYVTVEVDGNRDGRIEPYTGTLVAVASGSPSDVAVVQGPARHYPRAISLAQVAAIRPATNAELLLIGVDVLAGRTFPEVEAIVLEASNLDRHAELAAVLTTLVVGHLRADNEPAANRLLTLAHIVGLELGPEAELLAGTLEELLEEPGR